jgi:hypothetical protein
MTHLIPDISWYTSVSEQRQVKTRCPFATVEACPRFYQGISLLGDAGSTSIEPEEDERLLKSWEKSDLWPRTGEYATSVAGPEGNPKIFSNFCPEVAYDRFGYFASFLAEHADEIDIGLAHKRLAKEGASRKDWRWQWSSVTPVHYTDCALYSILSHRAKVPKSPIPHKEARVKEQWYKKPIGIIIIGIIITVIGGLILHLLL